MTVALILCLLAQIPDQVANEPVAEKRYQLALDVAAKALMDARQADPKAKLEEAAAATEFALKSLEAMDKPPHKNARNYKRIELRTREFLRRTEALIKEAGVEERPALEGAYNRINAIHEKVLEGVMSKKP
jgi:hypothetical protein